jgi:hypothetical protein
MKVKFTLTFLMNIFLMFVISCVPSGEGKDKAKCSNGGSFDAKTRSCSSGGVAGDNAPVGTLDSHSILEDATSSFLNLTYIDIENDKAISCNAYSTNDGLIRQAEFQGLRVKSNSDIDDAHNIQITILNSGFDSVTTLQTGNFKQIFINITSGVTTSFTVAGMINIHPTASTWVSSTLSLNQPMTAVGESYILTGLDCACIGGACRVVLTPTVNYNGSTDFNYTITDKDGSSNAKPVAVTVISVNDLPNLSVLLPIAATERFDTDTTTVVSGNLNSSGYINADDISDGDALGTTLTYEVVTAPTYGTLTLDVMGNFTYFSYAHQSVDTFTFRVRDSSGAYSNTETITINVATVDDAPVGTLSTLTSFNEEAAANGGAAITLTYSDEESDVGTSCSVSSVTGVYPTSACACAAGVCTVSMSSIGNFNGVASFQYKIFDVGANAPTGKTVSFTINPVDDNPAILITEQTTGILQFTESTTHVPNSYSFTLDGAVDLDGHSISSYSVTTAPVNGLLSGCLGFSGSGLNCIYTPADGNISDSTTLSATLPSTDLARISTDSGTFYAKNFGDTYNGININLIDVTNLTSFLGVDAKAWYNNGEVTFIIDAGVANGADILSAISASPVVSKIIQFDSNGGVQNAVGTLTLAGGLATADKFTLQVTDSNGDVSSQVMHISIIPSLDFPTICEYSSYADTTVCGINGCIGSVSPVSITPDKDGLIYYNNSSGACYGSTSGSWNVIDSFIKDRTVNELDTIVIDKIKIDEGGGSIEDPETITITNVDSSDEVLIPLGNISFFFDSTDNGFSAADVVAVGAPFAAGTSGDAHNFKIHVTPQTIPSPATIKSSVIEVTIQDSSGNIKEVEFTVTVQKISVAHGGWVSFQSIGPKVNALDIVEDASNHCAYSLDMCEGGNECSGAISPVNNSSADPDHEDAIYILDSGSSTSCYRMKRTTVQNLAFVGKTSSVSTISYVDTGAVSVSVTGSAITVNIDDGVTTTDQIVTAIEGNTNAHALVKVINLKAGETQDTQSLIALQALSNSNWEVFNEFCAVSPAGFETGCAQGSRSDRKSCIGTSSPVALITPTGLDSRYFDEQSNTCYRSTGLTSADWETYDKSASITIKWKQFDLSGSGAISEYKVFRRLANEEFDFSQQINREAITGSLTTYTFIDDTENSRFPPVPGTVYYYVVRPVINNVLGATSAEQGTGAFGVARIMAPPKNMVFAHRWMLNKQMCTLIDSPIDTSKNHRCAYKGPGDTEDATETPNGYYYDIGKDMLVDRFEAGCPFSPAPNCVGTADNSCIGTNEPGATGANISVAAAGIVYYDRSDAKCYISTGAGVSWTQFDTADLATYFSTIDQVVTKRNKSYNRPGLPPLTSITQEQASTACTNLDDIPATEFLGIGNVISHDLPSRKEQISYSLWDESTSDNDIATIETGISLNSNAHCNSTSAAGLSSGYNNLDKPDSNNYYSLPGTDTSGIRSMTTGSDETNLCVSSFGAQDVVGNVSEWTKDRVTCANMSNCTTPITIAGANQLDYGSSDAAEPFGRWEMDGSKAACIDLDNVGGCDTGLDEWVIENTNYSMGRMSIPMGLPVLVDVLTTFGTTTNNFYQIGTDITTLQLHGDAVNFNNMYVYGEATTCGAYVGGGHYESNTKAGVWNIEAMPCTATSFGAVKIGDITIKVDQDTSFINRNFVFSNLAGAVPVADDGTTITVDLDVTGTSSTNVVAALNVFFAANEMTAVVSGAGATVVTAFATPAAIVDFSLEANPQRSQIGFRCKADISNADYDE